MKRFLIFFLLLVSIFGYSKNLIIVSPHIDDSVLSIGGIIDKYNTEYNIIVIDVFSISAWSKNPKYFYGISGILQLRKNEENAISKILNYKYIFLDHSSYYPFKNKKGEDVYSNLLHYINKDDIIFCPLGLIHPNHVFVHNACEKLKLNGYKIIWYEDLPYMTWKNKSIITNLNKKYNFETIDINIDKKLSVIKLYTSQIFDIWMSEIKKYSGSIVKGKYVERVWY